MMRQGEKGTSQQGINGGGERDKNNLVIAGIWTIGRKRSWRKRTAIREILERQRKMQTHMRKTLEKEVGMNLPSISFTGLAGKDVVHHGLSPFRPLWLFVEKGRYWMDEQTQHE